MPIELPDEGAASQEMRREAASIWRDVARAANLDLNGFDSEGSLETRIAWAKSKDRNRRHPDPLLHQDAAEHCHAGSGVSSRRREAADLRAARVHLHGRRRNRQESARPGLQRLRLMLEKKLFGVLLVYMVSRLFRSLAKGLMFFQDEVLDNGLRAISIKQNIDTQQGETWKALMLVHGLVDEMQVTATADHVRSGLTSMFRAGFVTGALTLGYRRRELPDAPKTKKGGARYVA